MNLQPDRLAPLSAQERADLKITDMRFCDIDGMPKRCTLIKLYTNAGIVGYGEVRDAATKTYAAMLKSRLLGENPLNVDKLFRRVKQRRAMPLPCPPKSSEPRETPSPRRAGAPRPTRETPPQWTGRRRA